VRVVIAEDMALLREGLTHLLADAGFDVVGGAGDLAGLLNLVARTAPDVALIDIKMPPTHTDEGMQAAATIRQQYPGTAVLLLSSYLNRATRPRCWKAIPPAPATCSRNGSTTLPSWETPCAGCAQGNASSTRPSSLSCFSRSRERGHRRAHRTGARKSSASWQKGTRTTRFAVVWSFRPGRSSRMCAASS
jgi:CheY-like chemotaxis protein